MKGVAGARRNLGDCVSPSFYRKGAGKFTDLFRVSQILTAGTSIQLCPDFPLISLSVI